MFIRSKRASFHFYLWWNKNLLKHQKVSKYYESSCMPPIKTLAQVLSAPSLRQRKITHSLGSVFSKICFLSAGEIKEQTMVWFTDLTLIRLGFFRVVFTWGSPLPPPPSYFKNNLSNIFVQLSNNLFQFFWKCKNAETICYKMTSLIFL